MNIGDIFFALRGTDGGLQVDATKAAEAAGAAGAKSFSGSFGAKLKSAIGPAVGAGIGMAAGAALTGANQLDAATKRLVADAGLTGKAADDAGHSLASMYSNNLQGFDAIGAAMTKVHNDLGLTGAAADVATEKFLKFSTATGQDAAGAVTSFDDILDAWSLTAADAGSIMDKLVVSHQKFGGVIAESESALSAMAPAMQAANMSIDDGIALLNLFNAAGIDASKAPAALAKAVKALKPGQDLNDLIAQMGAIVDPTQRAQLAMTLFGARSGIGMAQAIKPGMTSLADLTASLGDTAGASDRAAEAALSFGDKATLMLRKVAGPLAEFGTQFSGLLMVAATIGPRFTTALLAGLGGIGGAIATNVVPQLAGALTSNVAPWMTAGTKAAAIFGAGMTMALPLIAAAAVVAAWAIINDGLNKQAAAIETQTTAWVKTATVSQMKASRDAIAKGYADIANLPLGTLLYGDQLASLKRDFDAVDAQIAATMAAGSIGAGSEWGKGVVTGIKAETPKALVASKDLGTNVLSGFLGPLQFSADKVAAIFGTSLAGVVRASKQTGTDGMLAMAAGVTAARAKPLDAFETLVEMLKHQLTPLAEVARLKGELTSKQLAAGLKSGDPAVRAQASAVAKAAADRLGELAAQGGASGRAAMAQLDAGIRSKLPEVSAASLAAKNAALANMNAAVGPAGAAGTAVGSAFAKHLVGAAAVKFAGFGAEVAFKTGGAVRAFAAGTPYVPFDQMALVHRGEIIVPAAQSDAIRAGQATLGGATYNVTVNNPEPRAAGPDIGRVLRRTAALGMT